MRQDVTAIIRASGERTADVCRSITTEQISERHCIIIKEAPFSRAIRRTFEIGLERGLQWTLAVDADVLLRDGAIEQLIAAGEHTPDSVFEIQGQIVDKFFGGPRGGGPHLYRTSLLQIALDYIPNEERSLRPERFTIKQMEQRGFPQILLDTIFAIHDYEQFYVDIYRKAISHSRKHAARIEYLLPLWQRLGEQDTDFRVAVWGWRASRIFDGQVVTDIRRYPAEVSLLLEMLGTKEKQALPAAAITSAQVGKVIDTFVPAPEYLRSRDLLTSLDKTSDSALPIGRRLVSKAGRILKRLGTSIQTWAES